MFGILRGDPNRACADMALHAGDAATGNDGSSLPTSDPELNALLVQLSDLARRCYNENRLIGQLINRRTQFVSSILNKLSPSSRSDALTYKENGATAYDTQSALVDLTNV